VDLKRTLKALNASLGAGQWLAPTISIIVILVLGYDLVRGHRPVPTTVVERAESPLSCQQIAQVGRWSSAHYGGPSAINLPSREFARKVADSFLDKLDPYKLILTRSEADHFRDLTQKAWPKAMRNSQCLAFENWLNSDYLSLRKRTTQSIKAIHFDGEVGKRADDEHSIADRAPYYADFASGPAELKTRLLEFGQKIAEYSHTSILPAYGNDAQRLIADSLNQTLFGELLEPRGLLTKAMLGAMDPFSTYLSNPEFDDFYQELAGGTSGVGVKVRKVPQGLFVEKILGDSPASNCKGLKEGSILTQVDGHVLKGLNLSVAKKFLKGAEKTNVKLTWLDPVSHIELSSVLTRAAFTHEEARISSRLATTHGKSVAVVEIPSFYGRGGFESAGLERSSAEDLEKVLNELFTKKGKQPAALVLDLRGNPGGFLEEAVSMGGIFLGNRPVVGVVERGGRRILRDHRAALYSGPLVVIVDKDSASASEILAGALKDHQRAIVVGETSSYGKGSVQRLFHLQDELPWFAPIGQLWTGVVKLTTSVFYSPLGHSPANGGVDPNLKLNIAERDANENAWARAKKTVGVPESKPFLEASELKVLHRGEKGFERKIEIIKKRNPWLLKAGMFPTNPVHYLDLEEKADNDKSEGDELLDKAVSVASEYAFVIQQTLPEKKSLSAVNAEIANPAAIRNAHGNVIGY
jgi:C-terminal peptidase prc